MNCPWKILLLTFVFLFCTKTLYSQYILNGSAQKNSCNCYTLTAAELHQSGSVWNSNKISLNNSFDFWFNVNLGCNDSGADGIVFILQPISTSIGSSGEGMGFAGVFPSIGIALDTYQNLNQNDPAYDHISIQSNGVVNHSNDLAGPVAVSASSGNVEDCAWHKLRITWDASTKWLRTYFDGVLRVEKQVDLTTSIFNNDPNVYWGFTGATGGAVNMQQFCTALDPIFTINVPNNIGCEGTGVAFTDLSESFAPIASYHWAFGDGTFSTAQNPPAHIYSTPGDYSVILKIKGQDGCEREVTNTIKIASIPAASMQVFDTCFKRSPRLQFQSQNFGVDYTWSIDGQAVPGNQQPMLTNLSTGLHQLKLVVSSIYNCGPPDTATASFIIKPIPVVDAFFRDACIKEILPFAALQTDTETTISQWNWKVQHERLNGQNVQHSFSLPGDYMVSLWATANNGCTSDTITKTIKITRAMIVANDTTIVSNMPAQLHVSANGTVAWNPAIGLSNPFIEKPIATLNNHQQYVITVTTPEGCTAEDDMNVKVYEGPAIYVPSAFTPNGDNKNEILLPVYAGMKELKQFSVFNRWGQLLFCTSNMQQGWDGKKALAGTYVWTIEAVNYLGKPVLLKGTVTIIK